MYLLHISDHLMVNKLLSIFLLIFIIGISYGSHVPLIPVFAREEINATYLELGTIGMANYLPYTFIPAIVGILLDKFNKGIIMSIGVAISTISIFLLSISNIVMDLIIIRAFAGLAHAFFWPAATAIVTANDNRSVKNVSRYTTFWVAGYMLGPLLGSLIFNTFGFRLLFQYTSIIMIIAFLLSTLSIKDNKHNTKKSNYSLNDLLISIKSNVRLYMLIIYYSASFGIVLAILPAYIKENGISEFNIGILFFLFGLARLLTLQFTNKLVNKALASIIIATILISLSMLIIYIIVDPILIALALILFGIAFSIYFPLTLNIIVRDLPENIMGRYIGIYETIFGIGWASGPVIAGFLADIFSNNIPYLIMFIIGLIMPTIILIRFNSR